MPVASLHNSLQRQQKELSDNAHQLQHMESPWVQSYAAAAHAGFLLGRELFAGRSLLCCMRGATLTHRVLPTTHCQQCVNNPGSLCKVQCLVLPRCHSGTRFPKPPLHTPDVACMKNMTASKRCRPAPNQHHDDISSHLNKHSGRALHASLNNTQPLTQ